MKRAAFVTFLALAACGGAAAEKDTKAFADIARESTIQLRLCTEDAGDCNAAQIRATARLDLCLASGRLAARGAEVPDSGVACLPQ
jgi:hypothetical protein